VVLIVVDTLRADHLGCYGYPRRTSPRIDALAADAIRFERALSPSPWTLPALASLMTALYPALHGARIPSKVGGARWLLGPSRFQPTSSLHASRTTLAEILQSRGFATLGLVRGSYPSKAFGFAQGFEEYRDNATPGIRWDVEEALAWLARRRPERFLVYLHAIEVHAPYAPIEISRFGAEAPGAPLDAFRAKLLEERNRFREFDFDPAYRGAVDGSLGNLREMAAAGPLLPRQDLERLVSLYDSEIAYTDYWIGRLIDGLEELGLYDEALLVLTSDHGEEFLEHGRLQHSFSYYEEVLRVPLLLRVPGAGAGLVREPVSLIDVLPTVLDVLGIEVDLPFQGRSLRPLWQGRSLPARVHVGEASFEAGNKALLEGGWKYVRRGSGQEELYHLEADPAERQNRCAAEPERCEALRQQLAEWEASTEALAGELALPPAEPAVIPEATLEQLQALGYAEP
jgi:arylsulfatase A-like enzyme